MQFNFYAAEASKYMNHDLSRKDQQDMLVYGANGEVGELTDMLKKWRFHGHVLDTDELVFELGDILWYLSGLCVHFGLEFEDVAQTNLDKLQGRYPEGFSEEASRNRKD